MRCSQFRVFVLSEENIIFLNVCALMAAVVHLLFLLLILELLPADASGKSSLNLLKLRLGSSVFTSLTSPNLPILVTGRGRVDA